MNKTYDPICRLAITKSPNLLVSWYLMASYAYYIEDSPILTDSLFDEMCVSLLKRFPDIKHQHKALINVEALEAGTGFNISEKTYPRIVLGALRDVRKRKGTYAKVK